MEERNAEGGEKPAPHFACSSCGSRWNKEDMEYCPGCGELKPAGEFEELIICRSAVGFYVCRSCYGKIV